MGARTSLSPPSPVLLASAAARADPLPDVGRLTALFESAAFDSEPADSKLHKWQAPIWIKVVGEESEPYRATVAAHADALSALTGLGIALAPGAEVNQNIMVWFTRKRSMMHAGQRFESDQQRLAAIVAAAQDGCYSLAYHWDDDIMIFAAVIVNNEREPAEIEHCLLEEMTEALGLPMAGPAAAPSIFNPQSRPLALSPIDDVLVRTLYDPRLTPGIVREEARERAREVIAELSR